MMRVHRHLKHAPLLLAGVAVLAIGLIGGMVRSADLLSDVVSETALVHAPGRVAGAATPFVAGNVTLVIELPSDTLRAVVTIVEPVSVFNLLRLAERRGALTFETATAAGSPPVIRTINEVSSSADAGWAIALNGEPVADLDTPFVEPEDTVTFRTR